MQVKRQLTTARRAQSSLPPIVSIVETGTMSDAASPRAALGLGDMPTWMGPQAESRKASAPSFSITGKPTSARPVQLSPGPIYLPSPQGPGQAGRNGPQYSMRGGREVGELKRGGATPGPGEYEVCGSVGMTHAASTSHTAPRYGWGAGTRDQAPIGAPPQKPACSEFYENVPSVGYQPVKKTNPIYGFSKGKRFDLSNTATNPNARNPGPGAYKTVPAYGTQVDSTLKSNPIYGFSRAERFRRPATSSSGGSAPLPRPAFGPQVISDFRSKPSFGFGGAPRFPERPRTSAEPGPGTYNA